MKSNSEQSKTLTPHVHADVIRAYANGELIEFSTDGTEWDYSDHPHFYEEYLYRVQPKKNTQKVNYVCVYLDNFNNLLVETSDFNAFNEFKSYLEDCTIISVTEYTQDSSGNLINIKSLPL